MRKRRERPPHARSRILPGACLGIAALLAACSPAVQPVLSPQAVSPPSGVTAAPEQSAAPLMVVVDKSDRTLTVLRAGAAIARFEGLQFGDAPYGHKRFQGDERTPEGRYLIDYRNPQSAYHLSLHISYPNADDRELAAAQGRSPGGDIFIHGQPNGLTTGRVAGDWTDGCIALANAEIEMLWHLVPDGTPIEIKL